MNLTVETQVMTIFFWLRGTAHSDCGYKGVLPKEQYNSENYRSTTKYFEDRSGEIRLRELHFDKIPCDIASTPFTYIVSNKFKSLAERMNTNVEYHDVDIIVSGEKLKLKYYFAEPLDSSDILDLDSPKTQVRPNNDELGYSGWINYNLHSTRVYYDRIIGKHWVTSSKTFGNPWIVSEEFKDEIENYSLSNFTFFEAIDANNK